MKSRETVIRNNFQVQFISKFRLAVLVRCRTNPSSAENSTCRRTNQSACFMLSWRHNFWSNWVFFILTCCLNSLLIKRVNLSARCQTNQRGTNKVVSLLNQSQQSRQNCLAVGPIRKVLLNLSSFRLLWLYFLFRLVDLQNNRRLQSISETVSNLNH